MKELFNLLSFKDFKTNWKPKEAKQTKQTDTSLDVVNEKLIKENLDSGYEGRYIKIEPVDGGLWLHLTEEGREELENNDINEDRFYDLFDDVRGNSEWEYHSDMGEAGFGLTNAPGFTDGYVYEDNGELEAVDDTAKIYWFPNYMVESFVETLKDEGKVFFDEG